MEQMVVSAAQSVVLLREAASVAASVP